MPAAAKAACDAALRHTPPLKELFTRSLLPMAEATMGCGDLVAARRWADDTVAIVPGCHREWRSQRAPVSPSPKASRSRPNATCTKRRDRRAHRRTPAPAQRPRVPRGLAADTNPEHAARLLGAAESMRQRHGEMRFKIFQAAYDASLWRQARESLEPNDF